MFDHALGRVGLKWPKEEKGKRDKKVAKKESTLPSFHFTPKTELVFVQMSNVFLCDLNLCTYFLCATVHVFYFRGNEPCATNLAMRRKERALVQLCKLVEYYSDAL